MVCCSKKSVCFKQSKESKSQLKGWFPILVFLCAWTWIHSHHEKRSGIEDGETQYKPHHANQQMALILGAAIDFHITKAGNEGKPRDFQVPYNKTWQWKRKMKRLSTKSFTLVLDLSWTQVTRRLINWSCCSFSYAKSLLLYMIVHSESEKSNTKSSFMVDKLKNLG